MSRQVITRVLVLSFVVLISCTTTQSTLKKSSEIPARRSFPVNEDIDPCTDFFGYTCNKVIDGFALREDRSTHTFSFSDSAERLLIAKQEFLGSLTKANETSLSPRARELRDVYQACMNDVGRRKEEQDLLANTVKQTADLLNDRAKLLAFLGANIDKAEVSPVGFGIAANQDDPDWYDVYLVSGLKSLPEHSYYQNAELMTAYKDLLMMFFKLAGLDRPEARADAMIAFEKGFMESYPKPAEFRELFSSKNFVSRQNFVKNYPNIKIEGFLKQLPQRTKLRNLTPKNYAYVNKALAELPLEDIRSIYLYHEVASELDDAFPEFYNAKFEFSRKFLGGANQRPVRAERCTRMVMSQFAKEIDAELIDKIFPNFPAEKIVKLAEKVRAEIIKGITANKWLSKKGRAGAIKKIKTADLMLVKPRNDVEWDFNLPADYSADKPIANARILAVNSNKKDLADLRGKRDRHKWLMGPLTINAYYYPANNQFVLPVGILQYPFYDPDLSETTNLGAVGAVIGHELGHAIDDKGAKYDEKGRLVNIMTEADLQQFRKRGQKLVDQFAKAGFDGELTLGENIGDHVGVTFAYAAAFADRKTATVQERKDFFIQYGRLWCYTARPKYKELVVKTDPHPLGHARVNEQIKHQPAFAEAFGCKASAPMTLPEADRVRIW